MSGLDGLGWPTEPIEDEIMSNQSDTPRVIQKLNSFWAINTGGEVILSKHRLSSVFESPLSTEQITIDFLCRELTAARAELAKYKSIAETAINDHEASEIRNHLLTEHRDRLAEALEQIKIHELAYNREHAAVATIADEALQSLTTNVNMEAPNA